MFRLDEFRDEFGNILPNSNQDRSENPSTFNAALFFSGIRFRERIDVHFYDLFVNKYIKNGGEWRTMEHDPSPDWSLDEKISTCAYFAFLGEKYWLKKIPLFPSFKNSSFWSSLRPDVFLYVLGSKYKWLRPFCIPFLFLKIAKSIDEFEENPQGESSGIQLTFIKLMGWRIEIPRDELKLFQEAFDIYYPEDTHPVRQVWYRPL